MTTELSKKKTVWFDLVVGSAGRDSPIISIGAVAIEDYEEVDACEWRIAFDESECDEHLLWFHGYSKEAWKDALEPVDACKEFAGFCRRHVVLFTDRYMGVQTETAILGQHSSSVDDGERLFAMFDKYNVHLPAYFYIIDTVQLTLAYACMTGEMPMGYGLKMVCEWLGVDIPPVCGALSNARAAAAVWVELCRRFKQIGAE